MILILAQAHASSSDTTGEAEVLIGQTDEVSYTPSRTSQSSMVLPSQTRLAEASRRLHGAWQVTTPILLATIFVAVSVILGLIFLVLAFTLFDNIACSLLAASTIPC